MSSPQSFANRRLKEDPLVQQALDILYQEPVGQLEFLSLTKKRSFLTEEPPRALTELRLGALISRTVERIRALSRYFRH